MTVVVAGIGKVFRRDDGVGPLVAARAAMRTMVGRDIGPLEDPLDLVGRWDWADLAIIVDAVRSGRPPGCVYEIELSGDDDGLSAANRATSTHGIGLMGAWRMALAVGAPPARVVVVGIEGADFQWGAGLSPAVAAAVPGAVSRVVELIQEASLCA